MKLLRKVKWSFALALVMVFAAFGMALAAGTPVWWDNPDGYTSWTQTIGSGFVETTNVANDIIVTMDINNTLIPLNSKEIWAQVEWTLVQGTGTFDTAPFHTQIFWTNDPCPPTPHDDLTNPIGFNVMANEGSMASGPEWGFNNSYELSISLPTQPQCERIRFPFSLGIDSRIDYRIEVQTLCYTPTAVTLANIEANNAQPLILGLAAILLLAAVSGGVFMFVKRRRV